MSTGYDVEVREREQGIWPDVTIIIPAYNAARELTQCLCNIRAQDYPHERLRVLVIDDDSTDDTQQVAAAYGATVLRNGYKNIERGKSVGLAHAESEFVFLLDSDNRLPSQDWLRYAVAILRDHPDVVGVQAARFTYDPADPPANRYCSLYGIGDPVAYYFRKRDHLSYHDEEWTLSGKVVEEHPDYYLVRFTLENMPTVGSQGFLTRKSLLLQTDWTPALFHVDSNLELVATGHNLYAFLRRDVTHDYVRSIGHLSGKLRRNALLFYAQRDERRHLWTMSRWTSLRYLLTMITVVVPFRDALRGYRKVRDPAWFLHPLLCVYVPAMYAFLSVWSRWRPFRTAPRAAEGTPPTKMVRGTR